MKKFLTLLLVIPIAMFAFAGSGKEDAVEQVTEEPTEITFWFIGDVQSQTDPYSKAIREILDGFEAEYPDIKVKVESVIWDQIDHKVKIAVKAGDPPDVTFFKGQTLAGHVNAGALQSLDKYVNTMPKEWRVHPFLMETAMDS
jgi:multiple sugar transport system substrate-binding protein